MADVNLILINKKKQIKIAPLGFSWTMLFFGTVNSMWCVALFRRDFFGTCIALSFYVLSLVGLRLLYYVHAVNVMSFLSILVVVVGFIISFYYNKYYCKNTLNDRYVVIAIQPTFFSKLKVKLGSKEKDISIESIVAKYNISIPPARVALIDDKALLKKYKIRYYLRSIAWFVVFFIIFSALFLFIELIYSNKFTI